MKKNLIIVLLFCSGISSCAYAPAPRQIVSSFPIDRPFDTVWSAVIEVFAELQLPIQTLEKDSGLIVSDWINLVGQDNYGYCDCGKLVMLDEVDRVGKFNVFVKKTGESSCEIKINSQFQQSYVDLDHIIYKRNCVSTGKLEAEIYNMVKEKVK